MKSDAVIGDTRVIQDGSNTADSRNNDAEFGGPEERKRLEAKLLRKIDARMSILVVIYILNYVSLPVELMSPSASSFRFNRVAIQIDEKAH
jgi:hypothetical protein